VRRKFVAIGAAVLMSSILLTSASPANAAAPQAAGSSSDVLCRDERANAGFSLSFPEGYEAGQVEGTNSNTLTVVCINGAFPDTQLSIQGVPNGVEPVFGTPGGKIEGNRGEVIYFHVDSAAAPGTYQIEIVGTSWFGLVKRSLTYTLVYNPTGSA
jgi:hypothetical protein